MIVTKKYLDSELKKVEGDMISLVGNVRNLSAALILERKESKRLAKRLDKLIELTRGSIELFDAD